MHNQYLAIAGGDLLLWWFRSGKSISRQIKNKLSTLNSICQRFQDIRDDDSRPNLFTIMITTIDETNKFKQGLEAAISKMQKKELANLTIRSLHDIIESCRTLRLEIAKVKVSLVDNGFRLSRTMVNDVDLFSGILIQIIRDMFIFCEEAYARFPQESPKSAKRLVSSSREKLSQLLN